MWMLVHSKMMAYYYDNILFEYRPRRGGFVAQGIFFKNRQSDYNYVL